MNSCHLIFQGTVQGVGFRWTTRHFAHQYGLKGFVRNLPDGNVEVSVQGNREIIEKFIQDLKNEFQGYILEVEIDWREDVGEFADFRIRF